MYDAYMSDLTVTYRGTVYPWQCDHMDHMNVMWYVGKFDEATWQLMAQLGLPASRLKKEGRGMVAVEQQITYKRELRAGDVITIRSSVLETKDKSVRFTHEMTNDENGELAASAVLVGVCIDLASRRAVSLPADVRSNAAGVVDGGGKRDA